MRKSYRTITETRHWEDKQNKATSSLFPIMIIAKQETKECTTKHGTNTESHNGSNNQQQQQNHSLRMDSSLCHSVGFNKRIKHSFLYINVCRSVIMCCSPNHKAVRAATHYHTRALQKLIYGKECYIVIVIYLPFKHKQFQIILFHCMQKHPP